MSLTDEERRELEAVVTHYPDRRAAAASALKAVQARRRWLSDQSMADVGEFLGLSFEELDSLATFGNMLFRRPVGRHVVLVCNSFACWALGHAELLEALEQELGVTLGETTPDDRFTLLPIVCLGACDRGPAIMVDADQHGPRAPADVPGVLEQYT